ncbi:MAG: hypothetical protein H7A49_08155 [Akkermansiaceae bacterium]|nr:hypothetical protein [Akkermansiaceae bacterium]
MEDRKHQDAKAVNLNALRTAIRVLMRKDPDSAQVKSLLDRATQIRNRALHDASFCFATPLLVAVKKNEEEHVYRPISIYGTDDKIIDRLTARYLRDSFDFCFSPSSLAFRGKLEGQNAAVTHHDALRRITGFRERHSRVYVAEADLRNFMDSISHQVVRDSLHKLTLQGRSLRPDLRISTRAIRILDAYLSSYSFSQVVLGQGLERLRKRDPIASFPWPIETLRRMHQCDDLSKIGIPQGGALSCFLTNLVLHEADEAVEQLRKPGRPEIEYLRYCDDMLILSSDAALCEAAMTAYIDVVERKKLPMHEPVEICVPATKGKTKSAFWDLKSKRPYLWARPADSGVPWIQFAGYQIRHDGSVRIRSKSLKKHRKKLTEEADKLLSIINPGKKYRDGLPVYAPGLRMDRHQIEHFFRMKLVALSVGRRQWWQPLPSCGDDIKPLCWAHGYRGLWQVRFDSSGLKELDRHRDRQLRRIRHCLRHLDTPKGNAKGKSTKKKKRRFYGAPFSYHGQFVQSMDQNPVPLPRPLPWIRRLRSAVAATAKRWLKCFLD